jgi:hypothetical protein
MAFLLFVPILTERHEFIRPGRYVCSRKVTGVTVVGVRGHLVAVEGARSRTPIAHPDRLLYLGDPLDEFELSAEDSTGLHALMAIHTVDVNRERLEFLG